MSSLIDAVTGLASPWAYVVVGVLAALEASAFVGLFIPGELALLAGGYIVQQGHARLGVMVLVAALGAIVGDSIGYEIGRHLGGRLRTGRVGRHIGEERWVRAEAYLEAKGGRAIFLGRFIGLLRALVPALAGAARMPYRRFLGWNAAGAVIWAPGVVILGYVAGSSYQRVEHYAGRASLLLLIMVASIVGVVAAARWIGANHAQLGARVTRLLDRPPIERFRRRYRAQLAFLSRRLTRGGAMGLSLTIQLGLLALGGWAFGVVLQDVLGHDDLARFDRPITTYVVDHRAAWLTTTMRGVTALGTVAVLIPLVVLTGLAARIRRRTWAPLATLLATQGGSIALYRVIKQLVGRPRPAIGPVVATGSGYGFPSGHATQAMAVWGALALLMIPTLASMTAKVAAGAVVAIIVLLVGASRVYLGVHWTTDVLGGWVLGALWLTAVQVARRSLIGSPRDPPG